MSIQKMARGPMMLMDKDFNIPLFQANTQMYKCTEVANTGSDNYGRKYAVFFKEIPQNYSVPEIVRLDITISNDTLNSTKVEMYEKRKNGYTILFNAAISSESIQSLNSIRKMLIDLAKNKC